MLKLDISKLDGFVAKSEFEAMFQEIEVAHKKLYDKSAPGSEFTGWARELAFHIRQDGHAVFMLVFPICHELNLIAFRDIVILQALD